MSHAAQSRATAPFRTRAVTHFTLLLAMLASPLTGCGEDEPAASQRGVPGVESKKAGKKDNGGSASAVEAEDAGPLRPPVALDAKSFAHRRDPFQAFAAPQSVLVPEASGPKADRPVQMGQYAFEDLKLIAIVAAGGISPRALFLASDGKSHTIKQGEYFSSAEVLLAAVNRDYVEIEVVDDALASNLNLQRGERRAIYLRSE